MTKINDMLLLASIHSVASSITCDWFDEDDETDWDDNELELDDLLFMKEFGRLQKTFDNSFNDSMPQVPLRRQSFKDTAPRVPGRRSSATLSMALSGHSRTSKAQDARVSAQSVVPTSNCLARNQ